MESSPEGFLIVGGLALLTLYLFAPSGSPRLRPGNNHPAGLRNPHNTCHFNAVAQALSACPGKVSLLIDKLKTARDETLYPPKGLPWTQQDAHETFTSLVADASLTRY